MIDLPWDGERFHSFCGDEMMRSEFSCFLFLRLCATQHDNFTSHLCCKLDGEMSQTSNTNNANDIGRFYSVSCEGSPDRDPSTHQWSCDIALQLLREFEKILFFPHCAASK